MRREEQTAEIALVKGRGLAMFVSGLEGARKTTLSRWRAFVRERRDRWTEQNVAGKDTSREVLYRDLRVDAAAGVGTSEARKGMCTVLIHDSSSYHRKGRQGPPWAF